jgi:hypothetical protein
MLLLKEIACFWFTLAFLISCGQQKKVVKWHHIEISPLDGSQIVTVITNGEKRYFMNGKYENVPEDNYLLLDISKVDRLGDGFSICWNEDGYKWKIASTYAKLIENKLDSSIYSFYQPMSNDDNTITEEYKKINCGIFLIREDRKPWGNLKVKYIADNQNKQ